MCRPATCPTCHKATWEGCGRHVDQVLRGVPTARRCACPPRRAVGPRDGRSVWARLLGRGEPERG